MSDEPIEQRGPLPANEPEQGGEGPVITLSKPWRIGLATGALGIAVTRAIWPALPIDALGLGLVALTVLLLFFDIERVEWAGITASRKKARLAKAVRAVAEVEVPSEPIELPPAPEPADAEAVTAGYGGLVHRKPFDLMPPTEKGERLLWSTEKIRIELIVLAGNSGNLPHQARWDEYDAEVLARHLVSRGLLPPAMAEITSVTLDARRQLLRGELRGAALATADTLALDLLQKLREIKRQYVRVRDPDVTLYRDQSLSTIYQETAGVMLVTLDDRGTVLNTSVYPRTYQYTRGRFTSWEWKMERGFDAEAWYRDPTTGQARMAFSESATFAGREYPEQWGLEFNLPRWDAGLD